MYTSSFILIKRVLKIEKRAYSPSFFFIFSSVITVIIFSLRVFNSPVMVCVYCYNGPCKVYFGFTVYVNWGFFPPLCVPVCNCIHNTQSVKFACKEPPALSSAEAVRVAFHLDGEGLRRVNRGVRSL